MKDRSPNDRKNLPLGNSSILLSNYAIKYEMQASCKTTNKNFYVQRHQTNQLHTNKILKLTKIKTFILCIVTICRQSDVGIYLLIFNSGVCFRDCAPGLICGLPGNPPAAYLQTHLQLTWKPPYGLPGNPPAAYLENHLRLTWKPTCGLPGNPPAAYLDTGAYTTYQDYDQYQP